MDLSTNPLTPVGSRIWKKRGEGRRGGKKREKEIQIDILPYFQFRRCADTKAKPPVEKKENPQRRGEGGLTSHPGFSTFTFGGGDFSRMHNWRTQTSDLSAKGKEIKGNSNGVNRRSPHCHRPIRTISSAEMFFHLSRTKTFQKEKRGGEEVGGRMNRGAN